MSEHAPFSPHPIYGVGLSPDGAPPQVLAAPSRYVQGDGVLGQLGRYLTAVPTRRTAILIRAGGRRREGSRIEAGLEAAGIERVFVDFGGECSIAEIERATAATRASGVAIDSLIAVGGGKCIDAGKSVAYRLGVPMISCPSLASNDAPCSAISVVYTPDGVTEGVESSRGTRIWSSWTRGSWPKRRLGTSSQAWATPWPLAAAALGELCANTLYAHGIEAVEAVSRREVTPALEHVVEANTLLSGIGFESAGVAAAHAVAQGLTVLPRVHAAFLHGEMVAAGLMTHLALEKRYDEAARLADFFCAVGLPAHLGHVGLDPSQRDDLAAVMAGAAQMWFLAYEPFPITPEIMIAAAIEADGIGKEAVRRVGDDAYRRLHGSEGR
jgi:glycerol dehydrogenase